MQKNIWIETQDNSELLQCTSFKIEVFEYPRVDEYSEPDNSNNTYAIRGVTWENNKTTLIGTYETIEIVREVLKQIRIHINILGEAYLSSTDVALEMYDGETIIDKFSTVYVMPKNDDIKEYLEFMESRKSKWKKLNT